MNLQLFKRLKRAYSTFIIRYISFILSYPHLVILIPAVTVFLLSYTVVYDFTFKRVNSYVPSVISGVPSGRATFFEIPPSPRSTRSAVLSGATSIKLATTSTTSPFPTTSTSASSPSTCFFNLYGVSDQLIERLNNFMHPEYPLQLSKFVLSKGEENVLALDFFDELYSLQSALMEDEQIAVISPVSNFKGIDSDDTFHTPLDDISSPPKSFKAYLIKYLNYDMNHLLTFLFLDEIIKSNHLIKYAKRLKLYVIHSQDIDIENRVKEYILANNIISIDSMIVTTKPSSIKDFINYYSILSQTVLSTKMFSIISNIIVFSFMFALILYMYLSIANEHKIRSNFGLLLGWLVSIFISCGAGVNIFTILKGYKSWRLTFDPSTTFTKVSFILIVMVLSSRTLFLTINCLSSTNETELHKRLYSYFEQVPKILRSLLRSMLALIVMAIVGIVLLHYYIEDSLATYISVRIIKTTQAIFLTVFIQTILQLSYLIGIIVVDLRKIDVTNFLNNHQEGDNEGINFLSSYLLKLNYHSHLRPSRSSFRFKLGQLFLKLRYPTEVKCCGLIIISVSLIQLLGIFMHWVVVVPYNLVSADKNILTFGELRILNDSNNCLYYLELIFIIVFIVTSSGIVFRLSHLNHGPLSTVKLHGSDFKSDIKQFHSIELIKNGHTLDILKMKTNSKCPYVVSVGLDHKVLLWSPSNLSNPINIATTTQVGQVSKEFWPINHINLNDNGNFIFLINYKFGLCKCFERAKMRYIWEKKFPPEIATLLSSKSFKIMESFFRKRTVPGFLARKILQKKRDEKISKSSRRGSDVSVASVSSKINSNFPHANDELKQMEKDDFIIILESGELITISCDDGSMKVMPVLSQGRLISAKKVSTPRISDRIICQVNNSDIIVATVINNNWKFRLLPIQLGQYNQELITSPLTRASRSVLSNTNEIQGNKPTIAIVEFVGMILKVEGLTAELIDILRGIVLKAFNVGHFKSQSFRVSHSEPTHCKFCGCASIQSFSIIYEDFDSPTLIIHTFSIDIKRSKNNICLRVERDPREIRCLGFNAVTEHQHWFNNIEGWELTDVNMIIGLREKGFKDDSDYEEEEVETIVSKHQGIENLIENSGLQSLRNRKNVTRSRDNDVQTIDKLWEGFIITVLDGKLINYEIPQTNLLKLTKLITNKINCIEKYGYKSIILSASNLIEIFYLGNDQLIEEDIYFSGSNATISSVLEEQNKPNTQEQSSRNQSISSELLFINKRRRSRDRQKIAENTRFVDVGKNEGDLKVISER